MSFTGGLPHGGTFVWGAQNVSNNVDTRVMPFGYSSVALNTDPIRGIRAPRQGVLRNFTARHNLVNGNGQPVIYRIRVNGVLTALQISLPTNAIVGGIFVGQVAVLSGDLIECVRIIAANVGSGIVEAFCACEYMGGQMLPGVNSF